MAKTIKPEWVKFNFHRAKASPTWNLPDYKWAWYTKLWINMYDSDNPGYLPNDVDVLWQLAGARTKSFFQGEGMSLVGLYFKRTEDGLWIYHPKVLETLKGLSTNPRGSPQDVDIVPSSLFSSSFEVGVGFALENPEEIGKVIARCFEFYKTLIGKDSRYTLTDARKKKAFARIHELMTAGASIATAEEMVKLAIQNLADNDFNMGRDPKTNGVKHNDWTEQIFRSEEEFQKRLTWEKPQAKKAVTSEELAKVNKQGLI